MVQIILGCVFWIVVNWIILWRHCLWDWFHAHFVAMSRESQYTGREAMSFVSCCAVITGHVDCIYPHKLTSHYREIAVTSYSCSHVLKPTILDVISYNPRLCSMNRVLTVFIKKQMVISLLYYEIGGSPFLRNVAIHLSIYTELHSQ